MTGLTAVLGFALWVILLTFIYALPRVPQVLMGEKEGNAWGREKGETHTGLLMRAKHAHLNALEMLPVFAVVVFAGYLMDKAPTIDVLAAWVLYARIGQSVAHLIGTTTPLILVRANFFLAQLLLIGYMGIRLI